MDGSRKVSLRKRRIVQQILHPVRECAPRPTQTSAAVEVVDKPPPVQVDGHQGAGHERAHMEVRQVPGLGCDHVHVGPEEEVGIPLRQMTDQDGPSLASHETTMPAPTPCLPMPQPQPRSSTPTPMPSSLLPPPAVERPRREARPNTKYSPEVYNLSKVGRMKKLNALGLGGLVED